MSWKARPVCVWKVMLWPCWCKTLNCKQALWLPSYPPAVMESLGVTITSFLHFTDLRKLLKIHRAHSHKSPPLPRLPMISVASTYGRWLQRACSSPKCLSTPKDVVGLTDYKNKQTNKQIAKQKLKLSLCNLSLHYIVLIYYLLIIINKHL